MRNMKTGHISVFQGGPGTIRMYLCSCLTRSRVTIASLGTCGSACVHTLTSGALARARRAKCNSVGPTGHLGDLPRRWSRSAVISPPRGSGWRTVRDAGRAFGWPNNLLWRINPERDTAVAFVGLPREETVPFRSTQWRGGSAVSVW